MNKYSHRADIVLPILPVGLVWLMLWAPAALGQASSSQPASQPAAQDKAAADEIMGQDCRSCHTCDQPTHDQLCLNTCSRELNPRDPKMYSLKGPELVLLDELSDRYLPVPFDHKGHSEMAAMTSGCNLCHHYTPEGWEHPACRTCHEISPAREDLHKPSLKGAYHRQCLNCHREWSHETKCSLCHLPRTGTENGSTPSAIPSKDDIIGSMHPPIPEPELLTYQSKYMINPSAQQTQITFRHKEHIDRFGFKCVECHREENCSRCHEPQEARTNTPKEHHQPCSSCHQTEPLANDTEQSACRHCHQPIGEVTQPFDHAATGWSLNRFHQKLACRACHNSVPFTAPVEKPTCTVCHGNWSPETFNHGVTGQTLNEQHQEIDCADCHTDRRFDQPPVCTECHEEEEIKFPDKRPGEFSPPETLVPKVDSTTP
ncbi:MAG: hypothetical protein HJJLKODD_00606 [Phycisphaerae bacterium]|nr:hypothetical protein [Phycisphaerae bacterium]